MEIYKMLSACLSKRDMFETKIHFEDCVNVQTLRERTISRILTNSRNSRTHHTETEKKITNSAHTN